MFDLVAHPSSNLVPLALDLCQTLAHLGNFHAAFGGKVDQVFLLLIETIEFGLQLTGQQPRGIFALVEGFLH
ncbi:MAG: hypothetical protein ACLP62_13415 [Acidimicrobiales bacterium]